MRPADSFTPVMSMTHDVFLSYARADDEPFVARLHKHLTKRGFKVWWDRHDMPSRALTFLQEIREAIDSCARLIAVVGPRAVQSEYVLAEWQWAGLFSKAVIPILRLGDYGLLPKDLSRLHAPDFRNEERYDSALEELVRILTEPLPRLGPLRGVPRLPVHFVPHASAIHELSTHILGDVNSPAPIAAAQQIVALHGMPGAGKSSTAAALARSTQARQAFPDGIVWLSFGSDALASKGIMSLGGAFNLETTLLADPEKSSAHLSDALESRCCLIVADDLWNMEAIQPIANALGPRCRLLATSRDAGIATALTNVAQLMDKLPEATSLEVLGSWVTTSVNAMPAIASKLARRCGYLPLALALCGAMVRDGLPWQDLLDALAEADLAFIDTPLLNYPYRNIFVALNVSFDFLQRSDPVAAQHYRDLVVFPPAQRLPQRAVITFWQRQDALSDRHARRVLMLLARKSLVALDGSDAGGTLTLHDLQYDFLRVLAGANLVALHTEWVETYSRQCGGRWSAGPNDGYFFQYLLWHLLQAGKQQEATVLLLDLAWLESKLSAAGFYSLLTDFNHCPQDADLRALHDALRLGGKGIAERPTELRAQVHNRLMGVTQDRLRRLLEQPSETMWLRALLPTLAQALGPLLLSIPAHKGGVRAVAPIDDGKNILSGGADGRIVVWDGGTGAVVRVLSEGTEIRNMAVSRGMARWAVVVRDRLEVIETCTGKIVAQRDAAGERVGRLAISEDGGTILYSTFDKEVYVWNTRNDQCDCLHSNDTRGVESFEAVGFIPTDGTFLTTESQSKGGPGTLRLWNPVNRLLKDTAPCAQRPIVFVVSSDGSTIASADGVLGARVIVTDTRSLEIVDLLQHESPYVNSVSTVAFSDDEQHFLAGTVQGELILWDRKTSKRVVSIRAHENAVVAVVSLPGSLIVTASEGTIKVWDQTRLNSASKPIHDHSLSALAVSEDNHTVLCGSVDSTVSVWSVQEEVRLLQRFMGHGGGVASVTASERRSIIATGGGDGRSDIEVRVWSLKDYSKLAEAGLDEDRALAMAITSDGKRLIVGSLFHVRVFRLPELIEEYAIRLEESTSGPFVSAYSLAVSRDDLAFVGLESGEIVVIDLRAGTLERRWQAHADGVMFLGLLAHHRLLSGSSDGSVKMWHCNGNPLETLRDEGDAVSGGGVTRDGTLAVTSSSSKVLTLWDLESMKIAATFTFDSPLWPSAITGDGRVVITGDRTGLVHFLAVERP